MPRGSGATSRAFRPTRGSFSNGWKSRPPSGSTAFRRPSPSRTRTPAARAARPSAPPPKPATICGCCSPRSARSSARNAARKCAATRRRPPPKRSASCPPGTRYLIAFAVEPASGEPARAVARLSRRRLRPRDRRQPAGQSGRRTLVRACTSAQPANGVFAVVDRLAAGGASPQRLRDSLETAFAKGRGTCPRLCRCAGRAPCRCWPARHALRARRRRRGGRSAFSTRVALRDLRHSTIPLPEPRLFSFNSPLGACPECEGFRQRRSTSTWTWSCPTRARSLREGADRALEHAGLRPRAERAAGAGRRLRPAGRRAVSRA